MIKRTGKSKLAVVGWGRGMGHKGHMYLASSVITQATRMQADPYFFVSQTVGKDDPIYPDEKVAIYQKVFPQQAVIFQSQGNLNQALKDLAGLGYEGVVLVVGSDQKESFKYLERPTKEGIPAYESFGLKKLKVISRQETADAYAQEEGPRATPMREILLNPNASEEDKFKVWRRDMPDQLGDDQVLDLMHKAEARLMTTNKTKKLKEFIERVKPMLSSMTTEQKQKVYGLLESALKDKADLDAKRKALADMEREPGHDKEAIRQRKLDLDKEARNKNVSEGSDERKQNALWAQITQHEKAAKKSKDLKQQHHLKMADQLRSQLKTSDTEGSLNEFAPDEGGGSRKFIPWTEFIEQLKQILHKDFSCKENIVKSTIKARFVPHDPMEYGPTMLYSYYETRAGGRNKGAVSTRGSIQVGKYTKGGLFGQSPDQLLTGFHLLKGHPFERHFDLTFDNIYKIANIIQGNTQGALEFQPQQQVNEFAPSDDGDNGQEDMFFKYAKLWYNGNLQVQQRIEETLAQAGWEIGPLESEEGGAFIVKSGDENGDTYMGWSREDLDGLNEGLGLDTISNAASGIVNAIPKFVNRVVTVGKREGKETIDMLKLYKAKMSGTQLTPQQEQFMNKQWKDIAVVAIAALGIGYDTAALGATSAVANVGKDAALDPLVNKGLTVAAEVLLATFGVDIIKQLSQALTTSTGSRIDRHQAREKEAIVNPELDARVNQQFQKAKMGFGGMSEGSDNWREREAELAGRTRRDKNDNMGKMPTNEDYIDEK